VLWCGIIRHFTLFCGRHAADETSLAKWQGAAASLDRIPSREWWSNGCPSGSATGRLRSAPRFVKYNWLSKRALESLPVVQQTTFLPYSPFFVTGNSLLTSEQKWWAFRKSCHQANFVPFHTINSINMMAARNSEVKVTLNAESLLFVW
jgi:hypothetical protein